MKIAIFLNTTGKKNINLSCIEKGNPGIGGADYLFFSLAYFLRKYCNANCDVVSYLTTEIEFPDNMNCKYVQNEIEAVKAAAEAKADVFVFRSCEHDEEICRELEKYNLKGVAWLHNVFFPFDRKAIIESELVKRIVCVGHEQLDLYRDHKAFYKSNVIYNAMNTHGVEDYSRIKRKNIVAYTGSLMNYKGFHVLAKVWKKILREVPDAKLWVFGSGQLYHSNAVLGKWGIADENYERKWRSFLSDENGEILKSVKFLGKVGIEKFDLYKNVKVGVVNPTGETETFCLCGIEYGACGIPVVSARKNGLLDTVIHEKTGLLIKNQKQLGKTIVRLLKNDKLNYKLGCNARSFVIENFDWEIITKDWLRVLEEVKNDVFCVPEKIYGNWLSNLKFLREGNRQFKKVFPFLLSLKELRILATSWMRILKRPNKN